MPSGEETCSAEPNTVVGVSRAATDRGARTFWRLRPLALNAVYLGGLLFAIPYWVLRGRSAQLADHISRRWRSVPHRKGHGPCVWIHGVSVGEIFSVRHFLRKIQEEFPTWEPVLSTTTRAGLEAARKAFPECQVFSYPFDLSFLVRRAFDRIQPQLVIIVEHELWPNFLDDARARDVPVVLINGRLSERSRKGYRLLSRIMKWPPPGLVRICAEDETSAEGFRRLGVAPERVRVTGNLKFDNTSQNDVVMRNAMQRDVRQKGQAQQNAGQRHFTNGQAQHGSPWVLVGASTHRGEEDMLLEAFSALHREDPHAQLILAPRRVERVAELERLVLRSGFKSCLWSQLALRNGNGRTSLAAGASNGNGRNGASVEKPGQVILVDTVGELRQISAVADVVFVGGSLVPFGGHNVIEPASLGRPVVIGPHYHNFRRVVSAFLEQDAVLVAADKDDLLRKLRELKVDPGKAKALGQRATETISQHAGASERTVDVLRPFLGAVAVQEAPVESR